MAGVQRTARVDKKRKLSFNNRVALGKVADPDKSGDTKTG